MSGRIPGRLSWALCLAVLPGCVGPDGDRVAWRHGGDSVEVLVFTRTQGFAHGSIPDGVAALEQLGAERGWQVQATDDPTTFEPDTLAGFDVIVFLSTTGDVLDEPQQAALEGFIQAGGGWAGVHSASDTEYDWPWYGGLVGAYFEGHPAPQEATLEVVDATHPSTVSLPDPWVRVDEWYNFSQAPRGVDVLLTIDESTYDGGTMGRFHPMAWAHEYDGGRSWYTAGGHTSRSYGEVAFREHLAGGIEWAAGDTPPAGTGSGATTAGSTGDPASTGAPPAVDDSGGAGSGEPGDETGAPPPPGGSGTDATGDDAPADDDAAGCRVGGHRHGDRPGWGWGALLLLALRRRSAGGARPGGAG